MFSYINELNSELDALDSQIGALQTELRCARADAEKQQDKELGERKVGAAAPASN